MKKKHTYVLGVGLSHDGSACLLKDGKIAVAIEKERLTRVKHDGGNDTDVIKYCLKAEGIILDDIDLVVQNANYGSFEFGNDYYRGERLFNDSVSVPVHTISHHLAHAYNALGTCPFEETDILVIDGCGSLFDECIDLQGATIPENVPSDIRHLFAEKDSFYHYSADKFSSVYKDFSPFGMSLKHYPMHPPTTLHSIGGLYSAVSLYCLNGFDDIGKLMGLAPFGKPGQFKAPIFDLKDGRVFVRYDWMKSFRQPSRGYERFKADFQYYADIAYWVQKEVEKAILYVIKSRSALTGSKNLAYSGGVALNAVANAHITKFTDYKNIYITPSAGDNGIAIGCAYYGWLNLLGRERKIHDGRSYFGKSYSNEEVKKELDDFLLFDSSERIFIINKILSDLLDSDAQGTTPFMGLVFQLNFDDIHKYAVNFRSNKECFPGIFPNPDCTIDMSSIDFIKSVKYEGYLEHVKIRTSNQEQCYKFLKFIRDSGLLDQGAINMLNGFEEKARTGFFADEELYRKVASLLAEGKIIGWFQDGSEFGPRALGNRSILADPRKADIQRIVNSDIKFREDFRPFAPSVLSEDVSRVFEFEGDSPYMIMVAQVKPDWKEKIRGVVHQDNSSRIQTVKLTDNEKYYRLIAEFKRQTGIPLLLNTSFNRKGMPIVETPAEAINFFFECGLDCLVMNNYLVIKKTPAEALKLKDLLSAFY
ncbi:carbamoyltransferase C-terminal domain-containing protein [Mucilaginibacter gossypii]|uniref:carbamoyltransferase family protein n=1 Tax=Mucilaginibacter gossypii TaxID=551996 RepID=UPI000DCB7076|nr:MULTISPECIES: carbamoyltransferase C-terminal domain-containing protein [Mucilaginibacter]QTE39756.1 carbamoyltransferase C-terminal domain-containing protein [Mucilaginibacter gossypii]RAV58365.1 hypothetical protein DIU36_10350 [Mucilaginibacter rubeus]